MPGSIPLPVSSRLWSPLGVTLLGADPGWPLGPEVVSALRSDHPDWQEEVDGLEGLGLGQDQGHWTLYAHPLPTPLLGAATGSPASVTLGITSCSGAFAFLELGKAAPPAGGGHT